MFQTYPHYRIPSASARAVGADYRWVEPVLLLTGSWTVQPMYLIVVILLHRGCRVHSMLVHDPSRDFEH